MKTGTALFWGFLFLTIIVCYCYSSYCETSISKCYIANGYVYKMVGDRWYNGRYEWVKENGVK